MTFAEAARLAARLGAMLGWPPGVFWDCTPAELRAALGVDDAADPLDSAALRRLMEAEHG